MDAGDQIHELNDDKLLVNENQRQFNDDGESLVNEKQLHPTTDHDNRSLSTATTEVWTLATSNTCLLTNPYWNENRRSVCYVCDEL